MDIFWIFNLIEQDEILRKSLKNVTSIETNIMNIELLDY